MLEFCQQVRNTASSEAATLVSLARVELAPLAPGASTLSIELQGQDGLDFTMIKITWREIFGTKELDSLTGNQRSINEFTDVIAADVRRAALFTEDQAIKNLVGLLQHLVMR
jgi:hypothetical protein